MRPCLWFSLIMLVCVMSGCKDPIQEKLERNIKYFSGMGNEKVDTQVLAALKRATRESLLSPEIAYAGACNTDSTKFILLHWMEAEESVNGFMLRCDTGAAIVIDFEGGHFPDLVVHGYVSTPKDFSGDWDVWAKRMRNQKAELAMTHNGAPVTDFVSVQEFEVDASEPTNP